jgi:hypothetical protein
MMNEEMQKMTAEETEEYWAGAGKQELKELEEMEVDVPDATSEFTINLNPSNTVQYVVDFDKVTDLEHVIQVLKAMNLHILVGDDNRHHYESLMGILKPA